MRDIVQGDVDYIRPKDQIYRRDEKVIYEYPPCKNCVSFERISNKVGSNAFTYFPKHPIENSCQHLHFKNPSNLGQFDTANSSRQFQNSTRKTAKIYQPNAKLFAIVQDDSNIPYFKNSYHTRYSKGSELHKSKLKRWNSEESSLYISKNLTDCERSDSYVKISPHTRKVSISNSTEVLYDTPYFYEQVKSKVSHPSISSTRSHTQQHSRQPLKSVLKNTGRLQTTVEEYSALEIDPQDGNDNDVYDPSLPYIPLFEDEHASLESTVLSQFSESSDSKSSSGSRSGKSGGSAQLKLSPRNIASVNPALNEWFDALELTSKLGWTLILYLAIRSHYNPITFAKLLFQGSREFVKATADYITREPTLLSFRKGDIIKVTNTDAQYADKGWLHGVLDGRSGMFPVEYVTKIGRTEARLASKVEGIDPGLLPEKRSPSREHTKSPEREATSPLIGNGERISPTTWTSPPKSTSPHQDDSGHSSGGEGVTLSDEGPKILVDDGKHSLFQFALQHFRGAKESGIADGSLQVAVQKGKKKKGSKEGPQWTWKDLVELVKFSQSPLKTSLLPLEGDLKALALESFIYIMRYTGDYPMDPKHTEVHCVYVILMNCHKHEVLRDEVYCQIMKQTTNNKSSVLDSCQRGWRLFSIIAAYFTCSDVLKPYLLKYLETNAYDKRRAYHGTAMVCLQNIRKTFRYGGRKNVPSIEEITAITAGRNSKRQIYRLPGGTERVINTKSTSVVQDILEELCSLINVRSPQEQEEFSLYCIVEGDTLTMPLAREEYVLDVTTELLKNHQVFYLVFCRSVYYYPLRLDNALYIEVVFNQIVPDYLAGFLLITPGENLKQEIVYDIAKIAALMHRAADLDHIPAIKEVKYLLPRPLLNARDIKPPSWVGLVQGFWPDALSLSTMEAKAAVLEILQTWPLFGSAFFDVQRITEPEETVHTILALNKRGVHFLDPLTHESFLTFPLDKIMSTRKVKGNDGDLYLDMKCGNLMKPRIITLKTSQAHEISRQIKQYITIEQRSAGGPQEDNPRDMTLTR